MKKGKYQVEMTSDDVYFANRQVDRRFEKLLSIKGKLRVVLPSIDTEKIEKETKDLEQQRLIKEITPDRINTPEKQEDNPVKPPKEEPEKAEKIIEEPEKPEPLPEKIKEVVEIAEKIEETVELVDEDETEEQEGTEIPDEEVAEIVEEVIEEGIQGNLFENILAEKTQEIKKYYEDEDEDEDEEQTAKAPPKTKKTFTFKSIITEKVKKPDSDKNAPRQKAGFKTREIEEPEEQKVKPQDIVFEEDEEIAKILEEKIKKSIPRQENKIISEDEQEITSVEIIEPDLTYEEESAEDDDLTTQEFESLGELIAAKKPQTKLDYLLLTAYYLQTSESLFKYSLKQLNSKVMPFLGSLIDHSIIHNAVAQDFIEVVPDYNGTAEVTEYRLTALGENYLINEL